MTHPSICIWVDITPKREKIAEKCIFSLCSTENAISKYQKGACGCWITTAQTGRRRKRGRSEGGREKEENSVGRKSGEPNLVRMRTRALSNRNVVFLLSQVSHLRWKKGKNRVKVQEK